MKRNADNTIDAAFSMSRFRSTRYIYPWNKLKHVYRSLNDIQATILGIVEQPVSNNLSDPWRNAILDSKRYPWYDEDEVCMNILYEHCDRCGAKLLQVPWKKNHSLCDQCENELEISFVDILSAKPDNHDMRYDIFVKPLIRKGVR